MFELPVPLLMATSKAEEVCLQSCHNLLPNIQENHLLLLGNSYQM